MYFLNSFFEKGFQFLMQKRQSIEQRFNEFFYGYEDDNYDYDYDDYYYDYNYNNYNYYKYDDVYQNYYPYFSDYHLKIEKENSKINYNDEKKKIEREMIDKDNKDFDKNYKDLIAPEKMHLRGLVNIASTCYMNSVLQCFCNIKELAVYFHSKKKEQLANNNKFNKQKFFPVFQEVIKQLWDPKDNSPYSPYDFKNRLGEMNPLFKGAI